ncbi:MAG: class IV adenylate cyclase [Candidatus Acidiferrales bacterium]
MRSPQGREIEIKLHVPDLHAVRRTLARLGAKAHDRIFESNTLYDTSDSRLRTSGRLIRLRLETRARNQINPARAAASSAPQRAVLTYKAPIAGRAKPRTSRRYKERKEIEVEVANSTDLARILEGLGMRPGFRYQKYRTKYTLKNLPRLELDLDETPAGIFLELEGPRRQIDRAARLLGYSRSDYDCRSYWDLHQEYCQRRGINAPHMIFDT